MVLRRERHGLYRDYTGDGVTAEIIQVSITWTKAMGMYRNVRFWIPFRLTVDLERFAGVVSVYQER